VALVVPDWEKLRAYGVQHTGGGVTSLSTQEEIGGRRRLRLPFLPPSPLPPSLPPSLTPSGPSPGRKGTLTWPPIPSLPPSFPPSLPPSLSPLLPPGAHPKVQDYVLEQLIVSCKDKLKKYEIPSRVVLIKEAFTVEVRHFHPHSPSPSPFPLLECRS
jgi:hypothetical protein